MTRKMLAVHEDEPEFRLWERAESAIRDEAGGGHVREGEILGELAASHLGVEGPLRDRPAGTAEIAGLAREKLAHRRHAVERVKVALQTSPPGSEEWTLCHRMLHIKLFQWVWAAKDPLARLAGDGHEAATRLWVEKDLGPFRGLAEFYVESLKSCPPKDEPAPVDTLEAVASALEEASVDVFGLSKHPPVVEEPWSPDEGT